MLYILVFILGLIVGSFLNVVIYRLKTSESIVVGRSHCPHCLHQLAVKDLIPIFSFLFQRGVCRYCQKKISIQYPAVELAVAMLFLLSFWLNLNYLELLGHQLWINIIRDWSVIAVLVVIFVYDLKWYQILDKVTVPAIILFFLLNWWLGYTWHNLILAALVPFVFFGLQYVVSKGKWIGDGDLRLGLLMGVILGWPNVVVALFLAYIIGAVWGIFLITLNKKSIKSQVPFGTFLSVGTLMALFWGEQVIDWYLRLI